VTPGGIAGFAAGAGADDEAAVDGAAREQAAIARTSGIAKRTVIVRA